MNKTAKEMTTLPLTLLQELVKEAAAELAVKPDEYNPHPKLKQAKKVFHRNCVKRELNVNLWENGNVYAGYTFTDKRTDRWLSREHLLRTKYYDLPVGRLGDGGFKPNWRNIRKLEEEMEWGYWLVMKGKLNW